MQKVCTNTIVATPDPPPKGVPNPIHDADGASAAGYAGALVAGVRTYGWACETIVDALSEQWLQDGWVDFRLPRPLFAGEPVDIEVRAGDDCWHVLCQIVDDSDAGARVVLKGTAGLGPAPWLDELQPPVPAPATDTPDSLPSYDLASVPMGQPLRPLGAFVSSDAAYSMVTDDLSLPKKRFRKRTLPPYFLAGRMAPLTRHNFTYGPTIHARSQIQHCAPALSDRQVTVGAQIVDAYERNGHWYQVLDGLVTDVDGTIAKIRHHTIFRPRGT
jgi:hypothetical protein